MLTLLSGDRYYSPATSALDILTRQHLPRLITSASAILRLNGIITSKSLTPSILVQPTEALHQQPLKKTGA